MLRLILSITLLGVSSALLAAGPLVLEGPAGNTPARYANPNITFNYDTGTLGSRSNDVADQLVNSALALWNSVATSNIVLSQGADVPVDITSSNFTSFIPDPNNNAIHNDNDGLNPIVYDNDGTIIDEYFGVGQGSGVNATVVGFASSSIFIGATNFTEGFAVINGNSNLGVNNNQLTQIIAHEIGHYFGLDHTQADIDNTETLVGGCNTTPNTDYPLMYPYACRVSLSLHPDDDASLSILYPVANINQLRGQLSGTFETVGGAAIRGANLWVEDTTGGDVYSIVSDYLLQNTGFFSLMLPPGTYILHANSINDEFNQGSSVGPYADTIFGLSFQPAASTIGADLVFDSSVFTPPALLVVTAGEATHATFRSDGSGIFSTGHAIVDPAAIQTSNNPQNNAGGGGSMTPLMVLSVFAMAFLRRKLDRKSS